MLSLFAFFFWRFALIAYAQSQQRQQQQHRTCFIIDTRTGCANVRGWGGGGVPKSVGGGGGGQGGEHTCMWCGLTPCHAGCLWRRAFRHSSCVLRLPLKLAARCQKLQRATGNGFSMLRPGHRLSRHRQLRCCDELEQLQMAA